jgi:hypothetical protein
MVKRRDLLGGGILGGLMGILGGSRDEAAAEPAGGGQRPQSPPRDDVQDIVEALDKLRQEIADQRAFPEIGPIRDAQRLFLRSNQKMPDFVEVGASHWFRLYDWHVRWQQPLNLGRDAGGHYTLGFMGTTVILRPDNPDSYISAPYDLR